MKKLFLVSFLLLCATVFSEQGTNYEFHVGKKNKYPIVLNHTVSAAMYLQFLKEHAVGEKYYCWRFSKYYEPSFMDTAWDNLWVSSNSCIKQTVVWSPERGYYYDYSLIPGHGREDYIIDAVSFKEVQQEFEDWWTKIWVSVETEVLGRYYFDF